MILFPVVNTMYSVAVYASAACVKQITRTISDAKRLSGPKRDYFGFVSVFSSDLARQLCDFQQSPDKQYALYPDRKPDRKPTASQIASRGHGQGGVRASARFRRRARVPVPRWPPARRRATSFPDPCRRGSAARWSARLLPGGRPRPPAVSSGASAPGPCS